MYITLELHEMLKKADILALSDMDLSVILKKPVNVITILRKIARIHKDEKTINKIFLSERAYSYLEFKNILQDCKKDLNTTGRCLLANEILYSNLLESEDSNYLDIQGICLLVEKKEYMRNQRDYMTFKKRLETVFNIQEIEYIFFEDIGEDYFNSNPDKICSNRFPKVFKSDIWKKHIGYNF